ncbi:MAG: patatin-like phospholipase family protein [Holophagaceae bacterium]|nr:patatin-like phospholipase family protein [Holophagaceae bacterium]
MAIHLPRLRPAFLALAGLLTALAGADPLAGQEATPGSQVLRLQRREPDYRFRLHSEYRVPGQKPLALALRGGSGKGLAHIGVLQGMDQENLTIEAITGTSAGSLIGSLYASGFSADGIARIFKSRDFGRALDDRQREAGWSLSEDEVVHASPFGLAFRQGRLDLMPGGVRSRRVRLELMPMLGRASWLAGDDFDQLRMPLRVVTSDLTTGQGRVFAGGSLVDVVMASTGLPGIFEPVMIDGHQYVDGGPFENLPVLTAKQAFPGMVRVGVAIGRPWSPAPKTNLATLLDASLDLAMAQTERRSEAEAQLVLRPEVGSADEFDFHHQVDKLRMAGRQAFDANREALEELIYGPGAGAVAATGLDLDADGVAGAQAWLAAFKTPERVTLRDLYRLLRRAHRDLPIDRAEVRLPATPEGRARLWLHPAPLIAHLALDLPADWPETSRQLVRQTLRDQYGLAVGQPFHEGAWSRALEGLLVEAILRDAPILDLRGSGFLVDRTLRLQVREPRISAIQSRDPAFQAPLARILAPVQDTPVRTAALEENLQRAATRLGLSRLRPELRQQEGALILATDPERAPTLDLAPHLAYESSWGPHLALDLSAPNFLGSGSPLQLHGAVNDLQSRLQGQLLHGFGAWPGLAMGLVASLQKQWLKSDPPAPLTKATKEDLALRTQVRFGMEDRGLLQLDLGRLQGRMTLAGVDLPADRADYGRLAAEWDSFDSHTLPTRGTLVRSSWMKAFPTDPGPAYHSGYLRLRHLWSPADSRTLPFGLDLDLELAGQRDAPLERWFVFGGADSMIGTHSASYLAPNFGTLRLGLPFTLATLFGVAIQGVPRVDRGWIPQDYRHPDQGLRLQGYGMVLRGVLKSLYVELAGGRTHVRDTGTGTTQDSRHISFLIGTRPFDLWKGR